MADVPQNATQLFRSIEKRITTLERRRTGAGGVLDTGDCGFIGTPGGDSGGGGGGGGTYTAGADIYISGGHVIDVNIPITSIEPDYPVGALWFDTSA